MRSKTRSALICALLMTVSLVAMRYGRDEGYIPAEDYKASAKEVFFMFDERTVSASAISSYSANNILNLQNEAESDDFVQVSVSDELEAARVLPPIITPPEDQIEVFSDSGA